MKNSMAIAILVALQLSFCGSSEPVQMRMALKSGDQYVQTVTTKQKMEQDLMGQKRVQESTTSITYSSKCEKVDPDGTMYVQLTYDRIAVEKNSPQGKAKYDSDKDKSPTDPEFLAYAQMVGHGFTVKFSPLAQVKDLIGIEEFMERVYSSMNIPDDDMGREIKKMLKEQFGAETMRRMLEASYIPFPEKKMGIGDTWEKTIDLAGAGFPLKVDNKYEVKDLGSSATLFVEGKISSSKDKPLKLMGMEIQYDLSGEQSGTQEVELDRGIISKSEVKQKMEGSMKIVKGPGIPEPMEVPLKMETTVTIETH